MIIRLYSDHVWFDQEPGGKCQDIVLRPAASLICDSMVICYYAIMVDVYTDYRQIGFVHCCTIVGLNLLLCVSACGVQYVCVLT